MSWNLPDFEMSQRCCHLDMIDVFAADLISWLLVWLGQQNMTVQGQKMIEVLKFHIFILKT